MAQRRLRSEGTVIMAAEQKPNDEGSGAEQGATQHAPKPPEVPPAKPVKCRPSRKAQKGYWAKPKNWIAMLTLIFVGIYTGFTGYQVWWLNRQSFISTQRAFIATNGVTWNSNTAPSGDIYWQVAFNWQNSGNTPPKDLRIETFCVIDPKELEDPMMNRSPTLNLARFIAPKQTVWGGTCNWTVPQLNAVKDKSAHLYIGGRAFYWDIINPAHPHLTEACIEIVGLVGDFAQPKISPIHLIGVCSQHNCADKECIEQEKGRRLRAAANP